MSECVVRMEMPENCECCPMCFTADVQGYHWCAALEHEVEQGLSRPKECPIICSLPEWHGDLIDRDVLLQTFQNADYETYNDYCEAFDTTEAAETIVPAEAERSEA